MTENYDTTDITVSPYSCTIDSELGKDYKILLFVEGRAIQGQELNNLVMYQQEKLITILDSIGIQDGTILKGSLPIIDGTNITVPDDLFIWAKGEIVNKSTVTSLTITGTGLESIGCTVTRTIYTEEDDTDLLDPATAWDSPEGVIEPVNSGEAGAHRVKYSIVYTVDSYEYPLWYFKDGVLQNATELPNQLVTMEEIEHRTRDGHGNFSVHPVTSRLNKYDNSYSTVTILPNEFYVDGVRVGRIQEESVIIPHALTTELVNNEGKVYNTGTYAYALNETPVKDGSDLSFTCQDYVLITRGGTEDGSDQICTGTTSGNPLAQRLAPVRDSLLTILAVFTTGTADPTDPHVVDYTIGSDPDDDCYMDGNDVNWSHLAANGASEPATGTQFWAQVQVEVNGIEAVRTYHAITDEAVVIGGVNDRDLAHNDVFGLEDTNGQPRVLIGDLAGGDDYVEGTDFRITNHLTDGYTNASNDPNQAWTESDYSQIHWLGAVPAGTVYVTYGYWSHTKEGHYVIRDSFSDPYEPAINRDNTELYKNTGYRKYVSFETACTEKPVDTSTYHLDYNVYRGRYDLVEVNRDSTFQLVQGEPSEYPKYPSGHNRALVICECKVPPDSPDIVVTNLPVACKKQSNLREMEEQITELADQVMQLTLKLDTEARVPRVDGEKGRWLDDCINFAPETGNGGDPLYSYSGVSYSVRSDPENQIKTLKYSARTAQSLTVSAGETTTTTGDRYITLARTLATQDNSDASLKNLRASTTMRINPYGAVPEGPHIVLDPDHDNWVEDEVIIKTVDDETNVSNGHRWTLAVNQDSRQSGTAYWDAVTGMVAYASDYNQLTDIPEDIFRTSTFIDLRSGNTDDGTDSYTLRTATKSASTQMVKSRATERAYKQVITFVRQRTISVTGSKWDDTEDNIALFFDNIRVFLTPTGTTVAGTTTGTVKSNASGAWTATFDIPTNVISGEKKVFAIAADSGNTAYSVYSANGMKRIIERHTYYSPAGPPMPASPDPVVLPAVGAPLNETGIPSWVAPDPNVNPVLLSDGPLAWRPRPDPIGEEIIPNEDYDILGVDLYFRYKDSTDSGVIHLRELDDGDPAELLKNMTFTAAQINISTDSSTASSFQFTDPVPFLNGRQYFLAIGSDSTNYHAFISESGGTDLLDTDKKLSNEYVGNLRSSSNGLSWDIHQTSDLKFCLRPAEYSASGTWTSANVTADVTSFSVAAEVLQRPGTNVKWYYSTDNGTSWVPFRINKTVKLNVMATQIKIKALLETTNSNISPILSKDITLDIRKNNSSSVYVSRNTNFGSGNEYYKVTLVVEEANPASTTIARYVSVDNGVSWVSMGTVTKTEVINGEFNRNYYEKSFYLDAPVLETADLTATTGGTLTTNTYHYIITATNQWGETIGSTERTVDVTTPGTNAVEINLDGVPSGATGVNIYRSTAGTPTLKYILETVPATTLDDGSDPDSAATTAPASPTARDYKSNCRLRIDLSTSDLAVEPKIKQPYTRME